MRRGRTVGPGRVLGLARRTLRGRCVVTRYYRPVPKSSILNCVSRGSHIVVRGHRYPMTTGLGDDCNGHVVTAM